MSEEGQERVLRFIKQEMLAKNELRIAWFGGEPLLRVDMMRTLSREFQTLCNRREHRYNAHITTNAYLLTPEIAKELAQLGVEGAQITIDGPKAMHDKRRILPDGRGTFDTILANVLASANHLKLLIRMNLDQENVLRATELLDVLEPVKQVVDLCFYPIVKTVQTVNKELGCLTLQEFAPFHQEILFTAHARGFHLLKGYTLPGTLHCGAYQRNAYIIDPRGDAFSCSDDVGRPNRRIGYLTEEGLLQYDYEQMLDWAVWSPFDDAECKSCIALPICMGGCLKLLDRPPAERCMLKHTLDERIRFAVCG